jgi:hypothetical protein
VADAIDRVSEATRVSRRKSDRASSLEMHRHDFAVDAYAIPLEEHRCARLQLLSGMNQRIPRLGIGDSGSGIRGFAVQKQAFDDAPTRHAMTEKPRRKDARIVQDDQIPRDKITAEVGERGVLNSVVTMKDEQPRAAALHWRALRD